MDDWKEQNASMLVIIHNLHSLRCRITSPYVFHREASDAISLAGENNSNLHNQKVQNLLSKARIGIMKQEEKIYSFP